jgi:hypothetical protein
MKQPSLFDSNGSQPDAGLDAHPLEECLRRVRAAGWRVSRPRRPARPVDDDHAPVGDGHPDTAKTAAANALPRAGTQRRRIYDMLLVHPSTADEVERSLNLGHQTASARVSDLHRDGWLLDTGERRRTSRGQNAIVWRAVPAERPPG